MVKQSRVTYGSVSLANARSLARGNAALQANASKRTNLVGARWKGLGRASAVFAVGITAALAAPREANAAPVFTDNTPYSLNQTTVVGTTTTVSQPCADTGDPGCFTNALALVDIDGDGDLDLLEANGGGFFATGLAEESVVYSNDGSAAFLNLTGATATAGTFGNPHSQERAVAAGDVDGDGDIDIYQPSGYGTELDKLWIQTTTGVWEDDSSTKLPATLKSHAASAKFGDIDGDGDLDLVVADWGTGQTTDTGRIILYTNDGTGTFTVAETEHDPAGVTLTDLLPPTIPPTGAPYSGFRPTDVDLVDIDGDFDLDILINNRQGFSRIFKNDGHGKFTDATSFAGDGGATPITSNYPAKVGPYSNNQEVCDIDEDGDLDIILDNAGTKGASAPVGGGNNVTQILLNDGTGKFTDDTTRILGEPASDDGIVRCADINADGHYDLVVGSKTNVGEKFLINDGTGKFNYLADALPKNLLTGADLTLALGVGDLNGDGKMDIVTGQGEGTIASGNATTLRLNRVYLGSGLVDTTPPVIRKLQAPASAAANAAIVVYMEVRDAATSEAGQMVKSVGVDYVVNTKAKKTQKGVWMGGDLFKVTVPAQADNIKLTLTPTVTDRANLTTTGTPIVYTLGTPPVSAGGGNGGGNGGGSGGGVVETGPGGAAGEAGEGGTAGISEEAGSGGEVAVAGKGGSGGKAGSGGTVGEEAGAGGEVAAGGKPASSGGGDDGGCSIASVPVTKGRGFVLFGFGLTLLGLARRRRNKQ